MARHTVSSKMLAIVGAPVPSETYFRAYGLRKSYGSQADIFLFRQPGGGDRCQRRYLAGIGMLGVLCRAAVVAAGGRPIGRGLQRRGKDVYIESGEVEAALSR